MTVPIEAVLFDWGGVLIDNPAPGLMAYCAEALGMSVEDYTTAHNRHGEPLQKGAISEAAFWERICRDLGCAIPSAPSLWGQAFASVYAPRADVFALAARLRERNCKTALLSNTEVAAMQFFANQGYDMFDATIFSCAEGTFKPEREIYEIAAGKLGVEPSRCAFIDDNPAYADGATSVGMHGIVYESLEQIENALRDLGAPC